MSFSFDLGRREWHNIRDVVRILNETHGLQLSSRLLRLPLFSTTCFAPHFESRLTMISLKSILVADDFSEHSDVALKYAAEFSRAFDAEVLLCHVVEGASMLSEVPPAGEGYFPPNLTEIQQENAKKQIEQRLSDSGITKGSTHVLVGKPFVEIVRFAREQDVDVIIVGTHGRGAIAHMLLGSVAELVVRKAPCPVLIVREGEHEFVMP